MSKKNLLAYKPPRIVEGETRTYILVYASNPFGEIIRKRPTFDLNRIKDLKDRKKRAKDLKEKIQWWLEQGYLWKDFDEHKVIKGMALSKNEPKRHPNHSKSFKSALELAQSILDSHGAYHTRRSYRSIIGILIDYLIEKKMENISAGSIDAVFAIEFMDYRKYECNIGNVTYNTNVKHLRKIFNVLKERGFNQMNPFSEVSYLKEEKKKRRNFTDEESKIVINYAYKNRRDLFYFLILQYACAIRPSEQRRMRFSHINIKENYIAVDEEMAKTNIKRDVAIPESVQWVFKEEFWSKYPSHYYVFGQHYKPHPTITMNHNAFGDVHSKILKKLHANGQLKDIKGLQQYSWKDTGLTDLIEDKGLVSAMDHAGHHDPRETLKYRHKKKINEKTKTFTSSKMIIFEKNNNCP